jgi:GNAT superfamily N-acetyltransferase
MFVREATREERPAVLNVLDGAMLATDGVGERIAAGAVLVAVAENGERVLGALVLDGTHIEAVAVRRRRRGQGIGTALVEAAADRRERLTAEFDADVRPFYEHLGFSIEPTETDGRFRGEYRP